MKALSNESQHLVSGAGCSNTLATEITSFEDPTLKSGRCSVEARREKIHRYMKKRNERNFSKKIKVYISILFQLLFPLINFPPKNIYSNGEDKNFTKDISMFNMCL